MNIFLKSLLSFTLFGIVFMTSGPAMADEPKPESEPESPTFEQQFIESNIMVSRWFDGWAQGIDLFIVGKPVTNKRNETSVRIENSTFSSEAQSLLNTTAFGINLRLPNLEEYWHLKFSSYDEQEAQRGVNNGYLRQTPRERNYGATVGLFRKLGNVKTSFEPRIELQNPLKVSHSLTFESLAEYKAYSVNPKAEFYASSTTGTGIFHALNFNYKLNREDSITLINEGEYKDRIHLYSVNNGISFGRAWNDKTSISYNLIFGSTNQTNYHLESYVFSISCNQMLYRKILDFQFVPHWDFTRDQGFIGRAGITMNINLNF